MSNKAYPGREVNDAIQKDITELRGELAKVGLDHEKLVPNKLVKEKTDEYWESMIAYRVEDIVGRNTHKGLVECGFHSSDEPDEPEYKNGMHVRILNSESKFYNEIGVIEETRDADFIVQMGDPDARAVFNHWDFEVLKGDK